jgi:protein-S-isoprenylcysteine O-methyltransferase Ste14
MVAILFGSAGRWDLPLVWAYVALLLSQTLVACLFVMDPALRQERLRPGPGGEDRSLRWMVTPFLLAHWIVAGLDIGRFHWSDTVAFPWRIAGLVWLAASLGLAMWAVGVNPFFSPVVRIQRERGHHLITAGPYRHVRHPGYVASLSACLFSSLALGSWWAIVPMAVIALLILRRTALEDRFLHRELEGYAAYAQQVRCRLIPGIW